MNIAFVVVKNFQRGGGIEKYTRAVATRLVRRGHHVTVYSMDHYGPVETACDGVQLRRVPSLPFAFAEKLSAGATAAWAAAFQQPRPDVVHLHSVAAGAFAWLPHSRGIPCILQMHGIEWQRSRWNGLGRSLLKFLEWTSLRQADAVTAVSQVQCEFYARTTGRPMPCIPTGADLAAPVAAQEILRLGLRPREYILFAARLVREKGAHYLIPAFRALNPDCQLVIAGDAKGTERYQAELRALAGNDPRILFPGFVQGRLLEELFTHARLYVQPSEVEGLSIALLEAMSYGNLCLVSDIPENREAIGDTGLCFRSRDIADLTTQLGQALATPAQTAARGARARQRVAENFSWDRIAELLEDLYAQVIRDAHPAATPAPGFVLTKDGVEAVPPCSSVEGRVPPRPVGTGPAATPLWVR